MKTIEQRIDAKLNTLFKTTDIKFLLYIDTDSLYFTLEDVFEKYGITEDKQIKALEKIAKEKITPIVNSICNDCCNTMRSYENKLSFKLETACSQTLWLAKKKYALRVHSSEGVTYAKPKFKVKGLEMVRSSTPIFVREKLKKSLDMMFDTDEKIVQKFIADTKLEFMKLPYKEVSFPRGANNLLEYSDTRSIYKSGCPVQVRGTLLYNHYLREKKLDGKYPIIGEGSKIKFVYLKMPNKLKENVIAYPVDGVLPKEFGVLDKIDYEMQFEKTFLAAMSIVMTAAGWSAEEHSSLDEFF